MTTEQLIRKRGSRGGFALVVAACAIGTVGVAVALVGSFGTHRAVGPAIALAGLFVIAEHRDRVYSDETGMSGSIAVGLCAAMFLGEQAWFSGAFFVCAVGALYAPHLRRRAWTRIVVNAMCFGASGLVAALVVHAVVTTSVLGDDSRLALAAIPAAAAYWVCNSVLLAVATSSLDGRRFPRVAWELIRSETVMLAFAVGGAICGLIMVEVSTWTGIAALVALLVALDVFVIAVPGGPTTLRSAWKIACSRIAGAAIGGVVSAALPKLVASAVVGALLGGVLGLAAGLAIVALVAVVRLRMSKVHIDRALLLGFVVAEVGLPAIGTASGVVGALAGLGPAIATAAGLVVVASVVAGWRRRSVHEEPIGDDDLVMAMVAEAMFDGLPNPANRD